MTRPLATKKLNKEFEGYMEYFASIDVTGSISGARKRYSNTYKYAVKCGDQINGVPEIVYNAISNGILHLSVELVREFIELCVRNAEGRLTYIEYQNGDSNQPDRFDFNIEGIGYDMMIEAPSGNHVVFSVWDHPSGNYPTEDTPCPVSYPIMTGRLDEILFYLNLLVGMTGECREHHIDNAMRYTENMKKIEQRIRKMIFAAGKNLEYYRWNVYPDTVEIIISGKGYYNIENVHLSPKLVLWTGPISRTLLDHTDLNAILEELYRRISK